MNEETGHANPFFNGMHGYTYERHPHPLDTVPFLGKWFVSGDGRIYDYATAQELDPVSAHRVRLEMSKTYPQQMKEYREAQKQQQKKPCNSCKRNK